MNVQERQSLENFLKQLTAVRGTVKDPEAETLITNAVSQQPDAAYLLVQRTLLMEQALAAAKSQIATLQDQLHGNTDRGSFLSSNEWGKSPSMTAPNTLPLQPAYSLNPTQAAPQRSFFNSSAGSFLSSVAATAAGVAGGAFLFQGIEHLLGNHQNGNGFLGQGLTGDVIEQTTINNYYSDDSTLATSNDDGLNNLLDNSFDDTSSDNDSWI